MIATLMENNDKKTFINLYMNLLKVVRNGSLYEKDDMNEVNIFNFSLHLDNNLHYCIS